MASVTSKILGRLWTQGRHNRQTVAKITLMTAHATKRLKHRNRALLTVATLAIAGCGIASPPIENTPNVVATPQQGQLTVSVQASRPVGPVTPVYVSIANGTDIPRAVIPSQVFALNDAGERVAPLPPGEAARQAGN